MLHDYDYDPEPFVPPQPTTPISSSSSLDRETILGRLVEALDDEVRTTREVAGLADVDVESARRALRTAASSGLALECWVWSDTAHRDVTGWCRLEDDGA